jgi:hypothetical protein
MAPINDRKKRIDVPKSIAQNAGQQPPCPDKHLLLEARRSTLKPRRNYFLEGSPEVEGGEAGEVDVLPLSRGVVAPPGGVVGLPELGDVPVPELPGLVAGGLLLGAPESRHPSVPARVKQATPTKAIERSARIFYSCDVERRANREGRSVSVRQASCLRRRRRGKPRCFSRCGRQERHSESLQGSDETTLRAAGGMS